jgi:hypothetical protein
MVRTSIALVAATCALLLLPACQRPLSANEQKVVGTWKRAEMDAVERIVYRPDRTMESEMMGVSDTWLPFAKGTWRLEGDVMVEEYTISRGPGRIPFPKQLTRDRILEFQPDKLVLEENRSPLVRAQ